MSDNKKDKKEETKVILLNWDEYNTEKQFLDLIDVHIKQAVNTDAKKKAYYDYLKLDWKTLARKFEITEQMLLNAFKKINSQKLNNKVSYVVEQLAFSFMEEPKTQANNTLIKEYAEHKMNIYSKDKIAMPDVIFVKPTADDWVDMALTLMDLTHKRYDKEHQRQIIERLRDRKIKALNNDKSIK